jgi:hypothetical protein
MQIFKKSIPNLDFFTYLDSICLRTDKYFLFDHNAYKKLVFQDSYRDFKEYLTEFYFPSKVFYIERELTYNSFTNTLRQICKNNGISFNSEVKYINSKYTIIYYIYFD